MFEHFETTKPKKWADSSSGKDYPFLMTGTMTMRFHRVGTALHEKTRLKKLRIVSCHQRKFTLNREQGDPSSPTAMQ